MLANQVATWGGTHEVHPIGDSERTMLSWLTNLYPLASAFAALSLR
jgi:hypothetical protein